MSLGCHCGGECCQEEQQGLGWLSALTPQQAADTIFPQSSVHGTPGFDQHVRDCIVQAAGSGQFSCFVSSGCSGVSQGGNIKLIQTGMSLALTGVSVGLLATGAVTAAALAPFTLGISALIGLFPMFFQHHAAAVALEQKTICAAVPAANNYLNVIDGAVRNGQIDAAHGIAALQSLENDFSNQVAAILKDDSSHCNAACVWKKELAAIVAELSSEYQDLAAQQAAQVTTPQPAPLPTTVPRPNTTTTPPPSGSITSPAPPASAYTSFYASPSGAPSSSSAASPAASSLPSWLPLAGAIAAGLFLARSL